MIRDSRNKVLLIILLLVAESSSLAQEVLPSATTDTGGGDFEEIIVTGIFDEPDRVTGSAHRIGQATLEAFGYTDINRVLNLVPGVYSREEDGVGLRPNIGLRGGSAERSQKVALMEDGVLISPAPYSAPAAYFFPLSARMVAVEVFKGASSIQYGPQTIGGAINLISAPIPDEAQAMLELAGGSDGYRHLHARGGTRNERFGVSAEFVNIGSDGFKRLDDGGNTGFEKSELLLKSSHLIGPGMLELRVGYAEEVSNETYLGLTEADFRADPLRRYRASALGRMEWDWMSGRATWRQPLFGGALALTAYVQDFDRAWLKFNNFSSSSVREVLANPDSPFNQLLISILNGTDTDGVGGSPDDFRIGTNDRTFSSSGFQGGIRWEFGSDVAHIFEIGARFHVDKVRRLHDEFGYEQIAGEIVLNNQPRAIVADNTAYSEAFAFWVRDVIDFGRWRVVPGLRVEAITNSFTNRLNLRRQENDYVVALPGIGTSFELSDSFSLLFGVHKGFSPAIPSLTEDLYPEESVNYELGGRWQGRFGRFEIIGFYNDYSNLTAICTVSSGCSQIDLDTQTNAGEVRAQGLEVGWNHAFRLNDAFSVPVALTYTYTDAEFREAFIAVDPQFGTVEPGFELPYIPRDRSNASIGLEGSNWGIQLAVTHIARMRDQAGSGFFAVDEGSDSSTVVDLAGHYEFSKRWTVSGRIDNATDAVYVVSRRPFGARPGKPLSGQLMVTYRY